MPNQGSIDGLAATLVNVQKNQDTAAEFNMNAFKRIMEKLDALPSMQIDIAVTKEKVGSLNDKLEAHMKVDEKAFADQNKVLEKQNEALEDLKRDKWIRHGITSAIGAGAGFLAGFIHK